MSKIPGPLDAVANISVTLFGNGQMSISGNIGDVKLALTMLDHARSAVNNQWKTRDQNGLLLPSSHVDVPVHPAFPLVEMGDVSPELRIPERKIKGGV